uniref:Uncharacterized protein n=1 Tax=Rhizophora mucronata TaxID=61149 RepID=A0A2P2PAR2_RHIMU
MKNKSSRKVHMQSFSCIIAKHHPNTGTSALLNMVTTISVFILQLEKNQFEGDTSKEQAINIAYKILGKQMRKAIS